MPQNTSETTGRVISYILRCQLATKSILGLYYGNKSLTIEHMKTKNYKIGRK